MDAPLPLYSPFNQSRNRIQQDFQTLDLGQSRLLHLHYGFAYHILLYLASNDGTRAAPNLSISVQPQHCWIPILYSCYQGRFGKKRDKLFTRAQSSKSRMAEVIPIPVQLETNPSFSSSAFQGSYYSQSSLLVDSPHMRPVPEPNAKTECSNRIPISPHSSTDWYHRTLQADCWNSLFHTPTPPIRVRPDTRCDKDEVHRGLLLSHDEAGHYKQSVDKVPPASPRTEDCCAVTPSSDSTSTNDSIPDSPVLTEPIEHAKDDTAMRGQPSRYVDYLSHDWKEEDVWSSWKHIVSKRKTYGSNARLENVLWRIWTKLQYRLKTVPPETLNW
jgi:hypothetical protein